MDTGRSSHSPKKQRSHNFSSDWELSEFSSEDSTDLDDLVQGNLYSREALNKQAVHPTSPRLTDKDLILNLSEDVTKEQVNHLLRKESSQQEPSNTSTVRKLDVTLRRLIKQTNLLIWIAHGLYRNSISRSSSLKENKMMEPSERLRLCSMLTFFCEHYSLEEKGSSQEDANVSKSSVLEESRATVLRKINFKVQELLYKLRTNTLAEDDYIHIFVALLRAFFQDTRLVLFIRPMKFSASQKSGKVFPVSRAWAEVYLTSEKRYVAVDPVTRTVDKCDSIVGPLKCSNFYCLAFYQDGSAFDVTAKYAKDFLSLSKKRQVLNNWWRQNVSLLRTNNEGFLEKEKKELDQIKKGILLQAIPSTLSGLKNHPLYVLQRHIPRDQLLFPFDSRPIGFFKGEPVYARHQLKACKRRLQWLKEGRQVKDGEQPVRVAFRRKRYTRSFETADDPSQEYKTVPGEVELFGEWQTISFQRPVASAGTVPLNRFGNVELFQPSMLPIGCVHIDLPRAEELAKRLGKVVYLDRLTCRQVPTVLDVFYGRALTGFQFRKENTIPVINGIVVCKEDAIFLMEAWYQLECHRIDKVCRERKRSTLALWSRLARRLLFRHQLRHRLKAQAEIDIVSKSKRETSKE
ncbi:DNA repair protein complementing XP-C cells-like isoform X2 [Zophobas morio]|uniref:DNA repair protein complementing XP-C cells-like isoform X2 n=1 Tax=Zophobas morio TaxID=2755281 RepID=UPI00308316F7